MRPVPSKLGQAAILCCLLTATNVGYAAAGSESLHLEELTSSEVARRLDGGSRRILLPVGGTEQSGPHLALGKHNARVRRLAQDIAQDLGNTLVAPVLAYVPEGRIDPPAGHMRHAGTISVPVAAFESLLDGAVRSLCRHGFEQVVLIGDHGGYQKSLVKVAAGADKAWSGRSPRCRVHALPDYYRAAQGDYAKWLGEQGFPAAEIGTHAGLADTSLSLATNPGDVRTARLADPASASPAQGVTGDPRRASAALGEAGRALIVKISVQAIRKLP